MNVKELIELLSKLPSDSRVVVAGYEGGYNDLQKVSSIRLQLDANPEWWYGAHEISEDEGAELAIFLEGVERRE